ncbi:hypothetical protein PG985_006733 [Apiospora marii]|uniref:Uncharacterized protein n=1 Tax=Apiospora marii TaxID=335849 RepID=A0ABR1SG29_9PEZI
MTVVFAVHRTIPDFQKETDTTNGTEVEAFATLGWLERPPLMWLTGLRFMTPIRVRSSIAVLVTPADTLLATGRARR